MGTVLLGVSGSVAAYKAIDLAHRLTQAGWAVDVVLTAAARRFVTALTFQSLTGRPVLSDQFEVVDPSEILHVDLARRADLALLAPATADLIGQLAHGLAPDLLTSAMLAWRGQPVILAPAMNTAMWEHQLVQANLRRLTDLGYDLVEPRVAALACGEVGRGALASLDQIMARVEARVGRPDGTAA
ncbi:MAG: phosphopantothenoylcysteine decarboxylase [Propionibacteriaceae bacterium]|jgi:phosphopantothenoylcysteine decarboxylase/phosphopantothenoylcysteine decarboxylase/phosphopantothenate--cysteine ligase|nr:phosphopantothenoylcysteine decarboxylase [Propionibacteriaceae bacterium]